ncbi:MAG: acetylxylan esterase [Isosphaeraceae bacterium]|nr:acetylxylan esterase [Isosphaeraceae bacterium]
MRRTVALLLTLGLPGMVASLARAADEAAPAYPPASELPARAELPDPLVTFAGGRVRTRSQWTEERRPELKRLFQHYMYGDMPAAPRDIKFTVEREDRRFFDGKATKREVTIAFGPAGAPKIQVLLVVPNDRKSPAPVFVGPNFAGNHTVVKDPTVALPTAWMPAHFPGVTDNRATATSRGTQVDVWAIDDAVARGYAVATFYCGDVAPDHPGRVDGVFPSFREPGRNDGGPTEWGAVAAWAWGVSRVVDYLVTDHDIDRERIAVVGHSRLGKAAIVAAAFDERLALAIPHQAGCGGTAPSRGKVGESVKQINERFPHWFSGVFKTFNTQPERLPFDQNGLVALVAPRPVLFTNAVEDQWANPEGQFQVLKAADPVYRFLGAGGLDADEMPKTGRLIDSTLGYHIRPGKHSMGREDWKVFLDFADKQFGKASPPK